MAKGKNRKQVTIYLSDLLSKKLKIQAVVEDTEMSLLAESAISEYLDRVMTPVKQETSEPTMRRGSRGERLAVYIPEELATNLRILCAKERRSLSDAVTEAIRVMAEAKGN
jgi:predicted transcriptional regulator